MTDYIQIVDDTAQDVAQPYRGKTLVQFQRDGTRRLFFRDAENQWHSGTVEASKAAEGAVLWRVRGAKKMTPYEQFLVGIPPSQPEPV